MHESLQAVHKLFTLRRLTFGVRQIIIANILILELLFLEVFMPEQNFTASQMFRNANRFIEAYHAALQPVCRDTGLPPWTGS